MPTFTAIALESLIEPRFRNSHQTSAKKEVNCDYKKAEDEPPEEKNQPNRNRLNISPALYITPEPTPIVYSSSDSLSPSPYVANRKGRGGKLLKRRSDVVQAEKVEVKECGGGELQFEETVCDNFAAEDEIGRDFVEDGEDFVDTRCDSLSVGSLSGVKCLGIQSGSLSVVSNQAEFYDADDDFSCDGSTSNTLYSGHIVESDMRSTRLSLLEEIGRRKIAEETLGLMCNQWQRVVDALLAQAGLRFPLPPTGVELDIDSIEQFCQEVVVARYVSEAIGKGLARAEAEIAAEEIIKAKDQEVSRLRDRLQYYEAVNHEMSQRNQEVIEIARMHRQKKKGMRKWLWGIGLSIAIGASVVAYSCLSQTSNVESLPSTCDSSDVSGSSAESYLE